MANCVISNFPSSERAAQESPLLARAIQTHGGIDLWRRLQHVTLRADSLGGPLPASKGLGRTFPQPLLVTIVPSAWRVEFHDYPEPGERAVFAAGAVQQFNREGVETFHRPWYRETFRGLRKFRRWSPSDAVYFFGYALATYTSVPFILPAYAPRIDETRDGFCATVRFPAALDTHSPWQRFWFDRQGLLTRQDYCADIVGPWATGAHLTSGYEVLSGLSIATRRDVYARVGAMVTPIPVLSARLRPVDVRFR